MASRRAYRRAPCSTAAGWAPRRASRAATAILLKNAKSLRFASYGILPLGKTGSLRHRLSPSIAKIATAMATADWATFNLRVSQGITRNFALLYEASWQYMDLNPNGRTYRYDSGVHQYQAVSGDFTS